MEDIARLISYSNGRKKIQLNEYSIYNFLKNDLKYRQKKIAGKFEFQQFNNGIYETVSFYEMKDSFIKYFRENYNNFEISKKIDFHDLINEIFKMRPIKKQSPFNDILRNED